MNSSRVGRQNSELVKSKKMKPISDVDRLIDLPESLIHQILWHLDIKEVVQTSLLSTRWRYLWRSVPNLKFSDLFKRTRRFIEPNAFMDFVDRVLILHHIDINEFSLEFHNDEGLDGPRIKTWIIGALGRHAQEISISSTLAKPFDLPYHMFTSDVKTMRLEFCAEFPTRLPISMCMAPRLKRLELDNAKFPNGDSNGELTISCLALEVLKIESCDFTHIKTLTLSAPRLVTFEMILEGENGSFKFNISCPNLKSLFWNSESGVDCSSMNLPSLVSAYVNVHFMRHVLKESARCWTKVLTGIPHVQVLTVLTSNIKNLTDYPYLLEGLPEFHNLRYVVFEDKMYHYAVVNSLDKLPNTDKHTLETSQHGSSSAKVEDFLEADMALKSMFRYLRKAYSERAYPQCLETELKFLKVLLKIA